MEMLVNDDLNDLDLSNNKMNLKTKNDGAESTELTAWEKKLSKLEKNKIG